MLKTLTLLGEGEEEEEESVEKKLKFNHNCSSADMPENGMLQGLRAFRADYMGFPPSKLVTKKICLPDDH